ncbi:hypothetical protein EB796_007936 [Bugula neritina]|uniref:Caspase family p20 domain-containing protein n=1 Tax=Bugula neritina TaxID=10212 RepID=A0A7J7K734_BUGNE|nr:hypothetical protein EB796_007936 [Bugula neritina]
MLTKFGRSSALREVLLYMEENYDANKIRSFLQKHNKHRQNILHLAALSSSLKELYTELQEYLYYADVKTLIYPDVCGNTPIHYVAAKYDETILKVLKYSLNEYSLLDSAYTTSHTLFSLAAAIQQTIISSVNETEVSKALVEVKQDLSAEEMLSSIHQFSKSEEHESLAALVVFSHGKGGMIDGHDGVSKCSTQEVVNTFNSGQVTAIPKLLFLSCCRGDISAIYNRAPHSFESSNEFPWPENEIELLYKPTKRVLPDTEREEEWKRLTFQRLDLPADCYVCFTTLPDSRSKAGKFFKYFSDYLSQLTNSGPYQPTMSIDDILNNEGEPPIEVCSEYLHRLLLLESASPSVQRVELVDLLTDVAGVLREKFQSKQYFNLCYSVNRDSNQVFIDVLPSGS